MNNFPCAGQRYRLRGFVFYPHEKGGAMLDGIFEENGLLIGTMFYQDKSRKVWILPDGYPTFLKLAPCKSYSKLVDQFVPDPRGVYRITGRYPDFRTNTGQTVWLDYDRSFKTYPIDPVARGREYLADRERMRVRRKKANQPARITYQVKTIDNGYLWTLHQSNQVISRGTAPTRSKAERDAVAAKRHLTAARNVR